MRKNVNLSFVTAVVAASLCLPNTAKAGLLYDGFDLLFVTPFVGVEIAHIGFAEIDRIGQVTSGGFDVPASLAYGGIAGVRIGPMGAAILYQRTDGTSPQTEGDVHMNKLYGRFSINVPFAAIVGVFHVDFGWAFLEVDGAIIQGFGGKLGAALDYYPLGWLSVGAGADLDLQGYRTSNGFVAGYGGTFLGRVGLHL